MTDPLLAAAAEPCSVSGSGFASPAAPEIRFAPGAVAAIGDDVAAVAPKARRVALVVDAALLALGPGGAMRDRLAAAGLDVELCGEIQGDPREADVERIAARLRSTGADAVVALGGGAAIDAAKLASAAAAAAAPVAAYALAVAPLPQGAPVIAVPTTSGAGAEATRTAVVSSAEGAKLWYWADCLAPRRIVLDPTLTLTLPPRLTAWTGLDAFVHALEASTNRWRSPISELYGHEALRRLARSLPRAAAAPDDLEARAQVMWAATAAGLSINLASTAIAHCISHAVGSLAPAHHGLATALGLTAALDWQVEGELSETGPVGGPFARAAAACGVPLAAFPEWWRDYLAACGVEARWPAEWPALSADALCVAMDAPENRPMRAATARTVSDIDLRRFAERLIGARALA